MVITEYQSGFRRRRSTVDNLVTLETSIRDAFVGRKHLVSIFFDLEKAYDTTWKHGILLDLYKTGLRGRLPMFICNFLSDRYFKVRARNIYSDPHSQEELNCVPTRVCRKSASRPGYVVKVRTDPGYVVKQCPRIVMNKIFDWH